MTQEQQDARWDYYDQIKNLDAEQLRNQALNYLSDTHWRENDDPRRIERASMASAYASLAVFKTLESLNFDATFEVFKTKANEEYENLPTAEYDEHGNITSE